MLSETSTTTTPLRPPGTNSLLRASRSRAETNAAATSPHATRTSSARTAFVRLRGPRSALVSGLGMVLERLPSMTVQALHPVAQLGRERLRGRALRRVLGPRERAGGRRERRVAPALHLVGDQLERSAALRGAVRRGRRLEERERLLEKRRDRDRLGLRLRRRLAVRDRAVHEDAGDGEQRNAPDQEQREEQPRRDAVREQRQRQEIGAPRRREHVAAVVRVGA